MIQMNIQNMTCGHCASTITRALKALDPQARIEISLGDRRVRVDTVASEAEVLTSIVEAGYAPRIAA